MSVNLADKLRPSRPLTLSGVPEGLEGLAIADLARGIAARKDAPATTLLVVCRDDQRAAALQRALAFFSPEIDVLDFTAWDCQPYDRASPNPSIVARRIATLARLVRIKGREKPAILLTTVAAALQRVPRRELIEGQSLAIAPGNRLDMDGIVRWLELNGFMRTSTVRETGEYAVRGGIVDLFAPGMDAPVRLDFFGDTLESIRSFDPESQRTVAQLRALELVPMSEMQLTTETMRRFRMGYVATFGAAGKDDALYAAISEGRRFAGMEHWLPLFHEGLGTLFDYLPGTPVLLEPLAAAATTDRFAAISDYHEARQRALAEGAVGTPYKPLPPDALYLAPAEYEAVLKARACAVLSALAQAPGEAVVDLGARAGRSFAVERADADTNVFQVAADYIRERKATGRRIILAAWSEGSRERLKHVLADHKLANLKEVASFGEALALPKPDIALAVLGVEQGFETDSLTLLAEQDILGDRMARPRRKARKAIDFLTELSTMTAGDIVVHVEHGIARFVGLRTVEAAGAPHDCLELHYAAGAKLFLPVENIELISRYGSEDTEVQLDRLGSGGWQTRKAKLKQRIREIAGELIKVAAERHLREAPRYPLTDGLYDEFAARFPYDETEDQQGAIDAVLDDLASGKPMDRLVCGDVGFGKTEVALRAAFAAVMAGKQVAVVVPTTLLARQHFRTFADRFKGLPVRVAQASRLVTAAEMTETRKDLAEGRVEIVVGTHALLGKNIHFKDLGLVIVDEEQHFGVNHKERLKKLRAEVHVLTLTATPIPRTLQLALTGVRELSIIATPPIDRLAVRSFVTPFDPLIMREALLRERYRGGQAFYVVPRIEDLAERRSFLEKHVPEVKVAVAHGQMAASELEDIMTAFCDGRYDVLLSTTIVESGLDIPTANTLIVHRADMFGLAQLYQLRGRVGRSKTRAYALFTVPAEKPITAQAQRRLEVLQSLDTLGAGFQLASHDLDIRGAGNLLGDEQSGHIKEVGYELYQQMLQEAIAALKAGITEPVAERWSPQITIGAPVLIPEHYVGDLAVRLGLYRRLADVDEEAEINAIGAEMVDRFGPLPEEVEDLLKTVAIKTLCRRANIEKIDAGPKGAVLAFRDSSFADPAGLVDFIRKEGSLAKVRPDMKIVFIRDWPTPQHRLAGTLELLRPLVRIADKGQKKAG